MVQELVNQKVVQHNDLIKSMANMNRVTLKIFELAVSYIDANDPPKDNTVYISKSVLYKFMDDSKSTARGHVLREAIITLHRQAVFELLEQNESDRVEESVISPVSRTQWNNYSDQISIRFDRDIMPYLIELRKDFTQYAVLDLVKLHSKYSIILYKWLSMYWNQYEKYRHTNKRTRTQLNALRSPYIGIEELRRITNTQEGYERMFDFERNVLQIAVDEISQHTRLNVRYEKVKRGRRIEGIRFALTQKPTRADLPYKEQDAAYLDDLSLKEVNIKEMHAESMESPYTTILGDSLIIGLKDYQSADTMASLQKHVYPLYDKLKEKRGMEGVKTHVSYVANKRQGYDEKKHNIVKYLLRAVEQYLTTVELQDLNSDK